jgi:hypothetical protein
VSKVIVNGVPIGEAFAPFDAAETRRLRRFANRVEQLRGSSFFETPGHQITATYAGGGLFNIRAESAGDEAVRAVIGLFRELYTDSEPTSAMSALKLLESHARSAGRDRNERLIEQLRALRTAIKARRQQDPRGVFLEEQADGGTAAVPPDQIIDMWLYGEHLHYDPAKADRIEEHEGITEMLRFSLESAIRDFTDFWGKIAELAAAVIDTPALRPSGERRARPPPARHGAAPVVRVHTRILCIRTAALLLCARTTSRRPHRCPGPHALRANRGATGYVLGPGGACEP